MYPCVPEFSRAPPTIPPGEMKYMSRRKLALLERAAKVYSCIYDKDSDKAKALKVAIVALVAERFMPERRERPMVYLSRDVRFRARPL